MNHHGPIPTSVLLLTGPAGAGKTALADLYTRTRLDRAVHLSLDDVRDRVRAGYANPENGWNELTQQQYDLARRSCALSARLYAAEGYSCVVDDAIFPDWPQVSLQRWLDDLGPLKVTLVLVTARPQVLAQRNATRTGHRQLAPATVQLIYDQMTGWRDHDIPTIDTSDLTLVEAVDALDKVVSSR